MNWPHTSSIAMFATFVALISLPGSAWATTATGTVAPLIPSGQFMSMTMTIDDTKTTFELTGPDFSWFAFGFDTTTMQGYALIVEGTDGARTAVEQNLVAIGNPGSPQATQNISIVDTIHHAAVDLTTIVIERLNSTGDTNDPIFSPSMTSLDIIGAYDSFSSPSSPNPFLSYHGSSGRGFGTITFSIVPEPATASLAALAAAMALVVRRRFR
ncbi:MAG: hypothetical protein L0228_21530 [Planctomycetes bacterium]|nr:hypothetical protein [Planctomycetota bacterium]